MQTWSCSLKLTISRRTSSCRKADPQFLKMFGLFFVEPIANIINKSIDQCVFPTEWKLANVTPVLKKKGDTSLTNYRPISVLPTLSKLLERFIQQQLMDHLIQHNLLSEQQLGFRMYCCMLLIHGKKP